MRVIAQELKRAADILQDKEDDTILVFDESKNGIETEYDTLADDHIRKDSLQKNGTQNGHQNGHQNGYQNGHQNGH